VNDNVCNTSWYAVGTARSVKATVNGRVTYYWQVRAVNAAGTTLANNGLWWRVAVR